MKHVAIDIRGQRFGKLLVVSRSGTAENRATWNCKCECGEEVIVSGKSLRTGNTRSCGCLFGQWKIGRFTEKSQKQRELFKNGHPIHCISHGTHLEWAQYKLQIRCKKCMLGQQKQYRKINWINTSLSAAKFRAKSRNYPCDLDIPFLQTLLIQQNNRCALTGIEFKEENKPSIDRKDSSLGYLKTNVQWVLFDVNRIKSNLDPSYFLKLCQEIANHAVPEYGVSGCYQ